MIINVLHMYEKYLPPNVQSTQMLANLHMHFKQIGFVCIGNHFSLEFNYLHELVFKKLKLNKVLQRVQFWLLEKLTSTNGFQIENIQ